MKYRLPPEEYVSSISGTLAFEDNWPQKGDYDFNDFVTGYSYSLIKGNNDKDVKAIRLTFIPRALGASYNSGFGIQLPIETNNIENVTGGNIEKDETRATIIIYEDTRKDAFGGQRRFYQYTKRKCRNSRNKTKCLYYFKKQYRTQFF